MLYRLARGAAGGICRLARERLAALLLVAGALAWTGKPSAYFGQDRAGFSVDPPGVWHRLPEPAPAGGGTPAEPPGANAWGWIFRAPESGPARLVEDFGYFLCGRHTGLFPYHPFTLLALLLFLLGGRRSGERWALLAALALVMLFFSQILSTGTAAGVHRQPVLRGRGPRIPLFS